jgi:hypothetical protein
MLYVRIVAWIALAEDRDRWWELINEVINIWFRKTAGNILIS